MYVRCRHRCHVGSLPVQGGPIHNITQLPPRDCAWDQQGTQGIFGRAVHLGLSVLPGPAGLSPPFIASLPSHASTCAQCSERPKQTLTQPAQTHCHILIQASCSIACGTVQVCPHISQTHCHKAVHAANASAPTLSTACQYE